MSDTAEFANDQVRLPEPLYEGGWEFSDEAAKVAAERFGLAPFSVLYYPGSDLDASLATLPGVRTIHADSNTHRMDEAARAAFAEIGSEAYCEDAESWHPPVQPDMVALINPTGINAQRVLQASGLREGGLVLWASVDLPVSLQETPELRPEGVINFDEQGNMAVDTEGLDEYFMVEDFDLLEDEQRSEFIDRVQRNIADIVDYVQKSTGATDLDLYRIIYTSLQGADNRLYLVNSSYRFMYKKQGSFFVYKRHGASD